MIDLHYWPTPNGWKITIALEEMGLPYRVIPVNIGRGEQFKPEFLAIAPNNRMPAIVDDDPPGGGAPIAVFESGAILLYLAEKTRSFIPDDLRGRTAVHEWLMWQMGGLGPMLGQANHFAAYAPEKIPYAIERYMKESERLFGVLERRLADRDYLAGEYSIADMAAVPWARAHERLKLDVTGFPKALAWIARVSERPAVQRGLKVAAEMGAPMDDEAKKVLFGQGATPKAG